MHIEDKLGAIKKAYSIIKEGGIFALSIDLSDKTVLDFGSRKITLYPNNYNEIYKNLIDCGFVVVNEWKTQRAGVFIAQKTK